MQLFKSYFSFEFDVKSVSFRPCRQVVLAIEDCFAVWKRRKGLRSCPHLLPLGRVAQGVSGTSEWGAVPPSFPAGSVLPRPLPLLSERRHLHFSIHRMCTEPLLWDRLGKEGWEAFMQLP